MHPLYSYDAGVDPEMFQGGGGATLIIFYPKGGGGVTALKMSYNSSN